MIVIHCIRSRGRREYGWQCLVDVCILWEEELIIFAFGLIGKVVDGSSSSAAGKNGINLSLCGLDCDGLVVIIIIIGECIVRVNFKHVAIHINY